MSADACTQHTHVVIPLPEELALHFDSFRAFQLQSILVSEAMAAFGRSGSMATNEHDGSMVASNAVAAKAKAKAKSWSRAFAPVRITGPQVDNGFQKVGRAILPNADWWQNLWKRTSHNHNGMRSSS